MENKVINLDELMSKNDEQVEATPDLVNSEEGGQETQVQEEESTNEVVSDNTEEEIITNDEVVEPIKEKVADIAEDSLADKKEELVDYKFKDDFIKKVVDFYEKNSNPSELVSFLEVATKDYDNLSDIQIMRLNFDKENSDLSEKTRNKLFEKELEKYDLDSFEEEDKEYGEILLKRDANKLRNALKSQQKELVDSIQSVQEPTISQEEIQAQVEQTRKQIEKGLSGVIKDNFIKVEANGDSLNYQVADTSKIVDYALDSTKFLSTFAKDGNVDWDKWTKVVAFAENPTQFISELIKHGKSLGRKAMESELKNSAPISASKEVIESTDIEVPSDDPVGFLKGMRVTKK